MPQSLEAQAVHGACACGRNRWQVMLPQNSVELADILFDSTSATRAAHTSPFATWLRVPLDWYRSATIAQFPDETALSIRRTFESPFQSQGRRQFCGYCGTQLTSWNERTRQEADYISLTLGSVLEEDLAHLEKIGLIPSQSDEEIKAEPHHTTLAVKPISQGMVPRGAPWFEDMVEDTPFGRMKRQKGGHSSRDGSTTVEWEVIEITEDDGHTASSTPAKRKLGEIERETPDVVMK